MSRPAGGLPWLLLLACCAGGSATGPAPAPPAAPTEEGVTVSMQIEALARGAGRPRLLRLSEVLRDGDRLSLVITLDQAAFVYVAQGGRALFPLAGDARVAAGEVLRVPEGTGWLRIGPATPTDDEAIYVVAASHPLGPIERGLCQQLGLYCPRVPGASGPPRRPDADLIGRGAGRPGDDRTLRAQTDEGGVAVLRFPYRLR